MPKFIEIDIPYKSSLANLIKSFVASFSSIDNFKCESFSISNSLNNDNYTLDLEINYGVHSIEYNSEIFSNKYIIIIDYKEIGDAVGTYFSAEKLEKLLLKIEYDDKDESDFKKKKTIIEEFIKNAKKFYNKKSDDEIICKILKSGYWTILSKLPKRKMKTIYLSQKQKDSIVKNISKFLKSKELYVELGIPWKRNYLLHGPPGTGKTSLIFALASKFNMNIYIINLGPKIDDSAFMTAIANLPRNTILLLEDVDALFVERKANDSNKSLVSFSVILNVLDGMARKNGLITFMTTNYINRLDRALIRPSRVDLIIKFEEAYEEQINQMFNNFFPERNDFDKFYSKISHLKFTIC